MIVFDPVSAAPTVVTPGSPVYQQDKSPIRRRRLHPSLGTSPRTRRSPRGASSISPSPLASPARVALEQHQAFRPPPVSFTSGVFPPPPPAAPPVLITAASCIQDGTVEGIIVRKLVPLLDAALNNAFGLAQIDAGYLGDAVDPRMMHPLEGGLQFADLVSSLHELKEALVGPRGLATNGRDRSARDACLDPIVMNKVQAFLFDCAQFCCQFTTSAATHFHTFLTTRFQAEFEAWCAYGSEQARRDTADIATAKLTGLQHTLGTATRDCIEEAAVSHRVTAGRQRPLAPPLTRSKPPPPVSTRDASGASAKHHYLLRADRLLQASAATPSPAPPRASTLTPAAPPLAAPCYVGPPQPRPHPWGFPGRAAPSRLGMDPSRAYDVFTPNRVDTPPIQRDQMRARALDELRSLRPGDEHGDRHRIALQWVCMLHLLHGPRGCTRQETCKRVHFTHDELARSLSQDACATIMAIANSSKAARKG